MTRWWRDGVITHAGRAPSTEDRFRIAAKVFVDCTGDGQLSVAARGALPPRPRGR
ncbi:MAG: hypothetical protein R2838_21880 [Caldilineaceae bacterium]